MRVLKLWKLGTFRLVRFQTSDAIMWSLRTRIDSPSRNPILTRQLLSEGTSFLDLEKCTVAKRYNPFQNAGTTKVSKSVIRYPNLVLEVYIRFWSER